MKPSIACFALFVSLVACSHGSEQQVRRREQAVNDSLFVNPEDYGDDGRQYATLPPAEVPDLNVTTLQPASIATGFPTDTDPAEYPCQGVNCTDGGYPTDTLPPTPAPDLCESCGDTIAPLDIVALKSDIEAISNEFIENFTREVLDPSLCAPDNNPRCLQTQEDNRAALDGFREVVGMSLRKMDVLICEQNIVGPYTPECPLNGLNVSVVRTTSDGRRLSRTAVDGIEGFVFAVVERSQTDTKELAVLLKIANEAYDAAEKVYDALPECGGAVSGDACSGTTSAAKIVSAGVLFTAKGVLIGYELDYLVKEDENGGMHFEYTQTTHDNLIEAHRKLDSVQRGVNEAITKIGEAIEKLDMALTKLDDIQRGVDEANEKLDDLLCPFRDVPEFTVLGQGCDATDQNCNNVTDECAEDKVPPSIALKVPPPDIPFKSTEDAQAFLEENVIVSDDCAVSFGTGFILLSAPDCCDCEFQVTAADNRCVNENEPGMATASRLFVLKVDSAAPVITCGFFTQQDPFHVSGGFDPCEGLPVPFPGENDPLHIDQTCFGPDLLDVALWYQIEDECDDGVLPVTVRVLSNELEGRPVDDKMTLIVERNDLPNVVHRARVYLSPTSCQDDTISGSKGSKGSKGIIGNGASTICEIEETEDGSVTTRFYDIIVSATDAAGNVGTKTCSVIVIPQDHYCGGGNGTIAGGLNSKQKCGGSKGTKGGIQTGRQRGVVRHLESADDLSGRNLQLLPKKGTKGSKGLLTTNEHNPDDLRMEYARSTQRYVISELSLEWDPNLDITLTVPSLPEPETNPSKGKSPKTKTGKGKGSKSGQRTCAVACEVANGAKGAKGKGKMQVDGVKVGTNAPAIAPP